MNDGRSSHALDTVRGCVRRVIKFLSPAPQDSRDIVAVLHDAESRHLIDAGTVAMMDGALLMSEMKVRDIMVPRSQMAFVDEEATLAAIIPEVVESGHSRFPVLDDKHEKVLGILLAKDLLGVVSDAAQAFDIKDIIRPAVFVPESKRLNILLSEFRSSRNHLAIVLDEYGEIEGLVSIEDVIEQIVGEIDDEHDINDEEFIRQHRGNRFTVKAHTPIDIFNKFFDSDLEAADYDTIGGVVTQAFGRVPSRGDRVQIEEFDFKVLRADKRRIRVLRTIRTTPTPRR